MPIYNYRCERCETVHEVWAKVGDDAPAACESCGAEGALTKMLAKTAFHLKGGGWYAQGYSGGGKGKDKGKGEGKGKASGSAASESASSSSTESSSGGDAAPASKPAASTSSSDD
jgi:putative FmdB family regulatory protein